MLSLQVREVNASRVEEPLHSCGFPLATRLRGAFLDASQRTRLPAAWRPV